MGLKGQRPKNISNEYQEPDLLTDVDKIIQMAHSNGFYSGNSLDISQVIKTFPDIEVKYEEMEPNQSGSFKNVNGTYIIGINKNHHKNRQKFTLAHELGHYILHKGKNDIVDTTFFRNSETDSIEYMANEFAAKLLMPEDKVRELIKRGIKNIGELSEEFGISASAMKYRIISLGYKLKDNV